MLLRRTLDPAFFNQIANHPLVRPWLGGEGELDLGPIVANPANIALRGENGGFILQQLEPAYYEAHSMFLPGSREAPQLAVEGFRYLFTETDCLEIITKVPAGNRRADGLARGCGFTELFSRPRAWDGRDCSYRSLTFDRWKASDQTLHGLGREFHDMLESAKAGSNSELPDHPDDEAHDRAVGATVLMVRAGNAAKAVWSYNRFAKLAGYQPIRLVSQNPPLIDVIDAVVSATEIVLVR